MGWHGQKVLLKVILKLQNEFQELIANSPNFFGSKEWERAKTVENIFHLKVSCFGKIEQKFNKKQQTKLKLGFFMQKMQNSC